MKDILSHIKKIGRLADEEDLPEAPAWLTGKMLVATPGMADPRFARTVVYICSHGPSGAMGLIINRLFGDADFPALLEQLNIKPSTSTPDIPVQFGGPVEIGRGFVLHSNDYKRDGTTPVDAAISVTATVEVIQDMANGKGPTRALMVLGYAGWCGGQLENELKDNGWLTVEADEEIIFEKSLDSKWERALAKIGISPAMLSNTQGNA